MREPSEISTPWQSRRMSVMVCLRAAPTIDYSSCSARGGVSRRAYAPRMSWCCSSRHSVARRGGVSRRRANRARARRPGLCGPAARARGAVSPAWGPGLSRPTLEVERIAAECQAMTWPLSRRSGLVRRRGRAGRQKIDSKPNVDVVRSGWKSQMRAGLGLDEQESGCVAIASMKCW